jgi:hypothetical protein
MRQMKNNSILSLRAVGIVLFLEGCIKLITLLMPLVIIINLSTPDSFKAIIITPLILYLQAATSSLRLSAGTAAYFIISSVIISVSFAILGIFLFKRKIVARRLAIIAICYQIIIGTTYSLLTNSRSVRYQGFFILIFHIYLVYFIYKKSTKDQVWSHNNGGAPPSDALK